MRRDAHHSYTEFDREQTVEIEGTLVAVKWQNPHTQLEVRVADSGESVVWDIETGSVNSMRRQNAPLDALKVGEVVKVAGWPSKRSAARMYATNVLGGAHELRFQTTVQRWPGATVYSEGLGFNAATSTLAPGGTPTLFRVWSLDLSDPDTRPGLPEQIPVFPDRSREAGGCRLRSRLAIGVVGMHAKRHAVADGPAVPD